MVKVINLDEELKKADSPFEYPQVNDPPEGWPVLRNIDANTWYQKALIYEQWQGQRLLPIGYHYDEDGNVVEDEKEEEE